MSKPRKNDRRRNAKAKTAIPPKPDLATKKSSWKKWFWVCLFAFCFMLCAATFFWPEAGIKPSENNPSEQANLNAALMTPGFESKSESELADFLKLPKRPDENNTPIDIEAWTTAFDEAIGQRRERFPDEPQTEHLYGLFHLRLKQTKLAEPSLRRCVEAAPDNPKMRLDLAELLTQSGRDDEALKVLEGYTGTAPLQVDYLSRLGECQLRFGNLENAERTFISATQTDPTQPVLWIQLGNVKLQQKGYEDANQCSMKAIELDTNSPDAWLLRSKSAALLKQAEEAQSALTRWLEIKQKALEQSPRSPFETKHTEEMSKVIGGAFRSLGNLYRTTGDNQLAIAMFEKALEADPLDAVTIADWASLMRRLGNYEKLSELNRLLVQVKPLEAVYYQNLANVSMEQMRPMDAEAALRLACLRIPSNGSCHLLLAKFLLLAGKTKEATAPAESALRLLQNAEAAEVISRIKTAPSR